MSPSIYAAYGQLFSVGFIFIGFHCIGMCGPILCGLQIGRQRFGLLFYQLGRTTLYMIFGAITGALGAVFEKTFSAAGTVISIAFGCLLIVQAGKTYRFKNTHRLASKLAILQPDEFGLIRPLFLGMCLAFMPCMITVWALGIAATTLSPLHGALIMALLVLLTTPALWISTRIPNILQRLQKIEFLKRLSPALLGISGIWMILVGLAGAGILNHCHVHFQLFGQHYMIMFF
ncbi:MAG: sulfite exporter TauE/SafE family protein [Myxococcaceae bacterium]|nr:sulfite exporter TauE/SafE family protein [Myxococcaceae bacterium]MBH2006077.1 sulfite exporter TauE/SafE family protein [Myxococcaceae bacterium]